MAKYPVENPFRDKQDKSFLYGGDVKQYPREGYEPTNERVAELQEKGYLGAEIKPKLTENNNKDEIIAELERQNIEYDEKETKKELLALLDDEDGSDK